MYHIFFYAFLCWWAFRLLPCLSFCEQCCSDHWGTCIFSNYGCLQIYAHISGRQWKPTPVPLPGKVHGQRSLVGCSPWGQEELDMTEWLHFHFSFSCTGEGNGNPLQCSCLENPRDGGAWWAAVYAVAQSRTRLKWLSSSSSQIYAQEWDYWIMW